jgi:hypothetical protein
MYKKEWYARTFLLKLRENISFLRGTGVQEFGSCRSSGVTGGFLLGVTGVQKFRSSDKCLVICKQHYCLNSCNSRTPELL